MTYALFCDYGLDDAVATVYILDHRKPGDRVDVVAIGGNSEKNVAYRNTQTLLSRYAAYGGDIAGIRLVDTRSWEQPYAALPSIHGADGMGDLFKPETSTVPVVSFDDWLSEGGEAYICSFGPCTLVETALKKKTASGLLIMGGCVNEEPNFNGLEFNHALDEKAFSECVKHPHLVATLDGIRVPFFNAVLVKPEGSELMNILVDASLKYATARHADRCYIYDFVTARYLFEPELFTAVRSVDPQGNALNELKKK